MEYSPYQLVSSITEPSTIPSDSLNKRNLFEQTPLWHHGTMSMWLLTPRKLIWKNTTADLLMKLQSIWEVKTWTKSIPQDILQPSFSCGNSFFGASVAKNFLRIHNKFTFITSSSSSNRFPHVTVALFGLLLLWSYGIGSSLYQAIQNKNFTGLTSKRFSESLDCRPWLHRGDIQQYNSLDQQFRNHVAILLAFQPWNDLQSKSHH